MPIRNKQLGLKVSEEFYWNLKKISLEERLKMVEVVEKALDLYVKNRDRHKQNNT
ncbi:hypothetical protein [endosymbiont GvMRE of Glomus versiforme]|uniref:hypothetical protein n=1 Tax=endosymbiont GvMRE of Glomus versiforme TaxID=2039283 RepID=UPI0015585BD1|nr:hypothetical protein [endosymbiont GvMRE of Glomus versiforme]